MKCFIYGTPSGIPAAAGCQWKKVLQALLITGILYAPAYGVPVPGLPPGSDRIELYVSPGGKAGAAGSRRDPLRNIEEAQALLRTQRKNGQSATVHIGPGVYTLQKPVSFSEADGGDGTSEVLYIADEGEALFSGSQRIGNWKKLRNRALLARLSPEVRGKIYVADLRQAGISDFGDPTDLGLRPDLICNKELQTLARWPNSGLTKGGRVRGETALPETYIAKRGTKEGVFEYLNPRQNRWAEENDPRLGGYWYWDWSEEFQKVDQIDTATHTIHIRPPFHHYGYKDSLSFFGLNLFCEIDTPGEWYLDRGKGLLFWYPPQNVRPGKAEVTLTLFSSDFMIELENCRNLTLTGLAFEEGRGSAIRIRGGEHCRITDCRVERFGRDGIHILGGLDHGISGCLLRTLGCGGIRIAGGDRRQLTPAGHFIEHSVVEYFSVFKRTYQPAVHIDGCGMRISNNRFRYSSSSAMRLEGNDILIEYNQVSYVVNESDDQGGLDVFYNPSYRGNVVRYNHWSDISGGTLHGAAGVRLDDMISGFHIYGNIFERCGARHFGAVQIHGGKDNLVENNFFFKCPYGVSFSTWGEKRWLQTLDLPVIRKKIYEEVDIRSEVYQSRYPALKELHLNADLNEVRNNLLVDCGQTMRNGKNQVAENNISLASEEKPLSYFVASDYLKNHGLKPIPYGNTGPQKGRWAGSSGK